MKKALSILSCLIILTLAFLPFILSTSFGKPFFEEALSHHFHVNVKIGSLSLNWLGPQSFHQVELSNKEINGSIQEIQSNIPFWSLSGFNNILDFFQNCIRLKKLPFLLPFSTNFSSICTHMHLKFVEKGTQKSSFFSKKANFERSPFLLKEGSFVFLNYKIFLSMINQKLVKMS